MQPRPLRRPPVPLVATALLALVGCSSGHGRSPEVGAGDRAALLVQPTPDSDFTVETRFEVLALERPDGTFTGNLLRSAWPLVAISPVPTTSGVALTDLPRGTYVAARILLAEDATVAIGGAGARTRVDVSARDLRAPFAVPTVVAGQSWLLFEPTETAALVRGSANLTWSPSWQTRVDGEQVVDDLVVTVTAVNASERTFDAVADDLGGLRVRVDVPERCELGDPTGPRSPDTFLRDLQPADPVAVCGILTDRGTLVLSCGDRLRRDGEGDRHRAYGCILEVDVPSAVFVMQVREVDSRSAIARVDPRPRLRVLTGNARVHRRGYRNIHLDVAALAPRMCVRVSWRGDVVQGTVAADEVQIEDEPGLRHEIEGSIGEVRVANKLFVVVPRRNDPLVVGGRRVDSAEVIILPHTVLFGPDNANRHRLTLDRLEPGQRVWIHGRVVGDRRVEALAVRVRNDGRGPGR